MLLGLLGAARTGQDGRESFGPGGDSRGPVIDQERRERAAWGLSAAADDAEELAAAMGLDAAMVAGSVDSIPRGGPAASEWEWLAERQAERAGRYARLAVRCASTALQLRELADECGGGVALVAADFCKRCAVRLAETPDGLCNGCGFAVTFQGAGR